MSLISDSSSEQNSDGIGPSTFQSTSQSRHSKSSVIKVQDQTSSKQVTKKTSHSHDIASASSQVFVNSSVSNVSTACQNLNINGESNGEHKADVPKGKHARKKERARLKQLEMPLQEDHTNIPANSDQSPGISGCTELTSLHDYFANQVRPLYANASSRYLENLSHHPQYQLSQNIQMGRELFSAPVTSNICNSSQFLQSQGSKCMSVPNSPVLQPDYMSPKCLQNVMQHPLLSQTFNANYQNKSNHLNGYTSMVRDKSKQKKNKKKNNENVKFDPYLPADIIENGLKDNVFIEGVLRINPKQFHYSYVSSSDRSEQDILIDSLKNRNRALEGDIVVVQLIDSDSEDANTEDKQKKGKVVFIKEKLHNRTCIGVLKRMPDNNRQKALFIPRDHRIPRLNIPFTSWPNNFYDDHKNYENTLFLAKIEEWVDTRFAMGIILCNIGQSGDMVTETQAILVQTDLNIEPFGPEVRHLYPRLDYKIPDEELLIREDCRKLCLYSIDPSNCRDIDDAVSCRELQNGNYEIGVHIADVSHFLTENTILDEKVGDKATTIYLVERAYHMLPDDLCMLCSLFPGVDKLTFSVFWEITKDAKILSHRFAKTVVNSCAQLSYDHAQDILENKDNSEENFPEIYNGFKYNDLQKTIKMLGNIAATFRKNRFEGGALRIDQPKLSFHLNAASGLPDSFCIYESKESHQLIEEFMLLANMTVAERIREDHPKLAFLRSHPPPSGYMLKQLSKALKPMGIDLDISSAGALHHSLMPHVVPTDTDAGKAMVLNMLCAKPMARAKYFCADGCDDDDFSHYALNVPLYTHFTSPIRRYADIMVHRLLAASLNYTQMPEWDVLKVRMIAAQCNKQKYNAKKASELSNELYTLKYIERNSPMLTDAAVVEIREKYIDVIVVAMGLNRRIFFNNDFPGKYLCIKHEDSAKLSKMQLTWDAVDDSPQITQMIQIFSVLQVELYKDEDLGKIDTKLVRPQENNA